MQKKLIRGSILLLITFGIFGFTTFLFQVVIARMLSFSDYGVLGALSSIIYITAIFSESVQTVIAKYVAKEKTPGKLKNLFKRSYKKALYASFSIYIIYLVISIPLSYILKINYLLLSINGLFIFISFFSPIGRGVMQGSERFKSLGWNMITEVFGKLFFGVLLVYFGWRVYGAVAGILIGGFLGIFFGIFALQDILRSKEERANTPKIYSDLGPAFVITLIIVLFYSIDIIIAKIFFEPEIAGMYSILSVLSKAIFWGTLPISKVMFPLVTSQEADKTNKPKNIFNISLCMLLFLITTALALFYFYPHQIVLLFSGKVISEPQNTLFYLGIATSLISVSNLILLYKLSQGKTKRYYVLFICLLIEIILLVLFSASILQLSMAFLISATMLLLISFLLNR